MKEFDIFKNPNEEEYNEISEAVKINDNYCPCLSYKNEDTKCMCKNFRDSKDTDFCHCGRFYKVKNYETLAVVGNVTSDNEAAFYHNWCEALGYNGFIVLGIPLDLHDYHISGEPYMNLNKTKIAKADGVLLLADENKDLAPFVNELLDWAERLGKRVLTKGDLA